MGGLPDLKVLNLRANKLSKVYTKLGGVSKTLTHIDLSENKLDMTVPKDADDLILELSSLKKIQSINLLKNPILKVFPEFWVSVV